MAINLTNLFTALGHLYYPLKRQHAVVQGNLTTDVAAAVSGLGVTNADIGGPLASGLAGCQSTSQLGSLIRTAAQKYLCRVVAADVALADPNSVPLALRELIRQMLSQSYKVSACTVTATPTAVSGIVGTGAVVATVLNPYGVTQDNQFAETGILTCTGDAQNGTATAGSEPFQYRGDFAPASDLGFDWPGYSGSSARVDTIDAGGSSPNLLTNSDFEDFAVANTPDSWTIGAGSVGVSIFSEATNFYAGSKALKFLGTGSVRPILRQTLTTLKPNRVYAVNVWLRASGTLTTAANLKIRLVDGSNAVITDDASGANGVTVDLTTLTTVYVAHGGVLITPKTLPAVVKLQIEASNGADLVTSEAVYVDSLAMAEATYLYAGGPGLGIFAGAVPFMTNDAFSIATANNQNSAVNGSTFQRVFDRLYGMRAQQLLLPTAGSTLLNDSLIA